MAKLSFLLFLFLSACTLSPKFTVGQCVILERDPEIADVEEPIIFLIREVRARHYLVNIYWEDDAQFGASSIASDIKSTDSVMKLVECPKETPK